MNIAPTQWLEEYDKAVSIYRQQGNHKKVSFPITWLLIKVAQDVDAFCFSKWHLQQMRDKLAQYVDKELTFRSQIAKLYGQALSLTQFANQSEKYDRNTCKTCKDYMYLSLLFCKTYCSISPHNQAASPKDASTISPCASALPPKSPST